RHGTVIRRRWSGAVTAALRPAAPQAPRSPSVLGLLVELQHVPVGRLDRRVRPPRLARDVGRARSPRTQLLDGRGDVIGGEGEVGARARLLPEGGGGGQGDGGLRAGGPGLEPSRLLTHLGIPHDVEAEDVAVELQRRLLVADVEDGGGYRGDHGPTLCRSRLRRNGGGGAAAGGGAVLRRGGPQAGRALTSGCRRRGPWRASGQAAHRRGRCPR